MLIIFMRVGGTYTSTLISLSRDRCHEPMACGAIHMSRVFVIVNWLEGTRGIQHPSRVLPCQGPDCVDGFAESSRGGGGGGHSIGNSEVTSAEACSAFSRRGASCGSKSTGSEGASSAALMIRAAFCLILFRRALPSRLPVLLSADNEVPDLPNHH